MGKILDFFREIYYNTYNRMKGKEKVGVFQKSFLKESVPVAERYEKGEKRPFRFGAALLNQ